jgi:hypothetical protein
MFITFVERFFSPSNREYFDHDLNAHVDPDEQPSATITKAFYKLNRSINKIELAQYIGRDLRIEKALKVTTQIEMIKYDLSSDWISEDQKKAIFAILLFLETMPYKADKDCSDDAYLILLLPHLEEVILNNYLRSKDWKEKLYAPFETLKKMFMIRLRLGFGEFSEKDISAGDLSLLAKQNNLKSIQNAVSKKELWALKGKGPSQRIDSQSARNWLTSKIKNRLIHFSWAIDGPNLNSRTKLNYLNYFKVKYIQILCLDDLEHLKDCPDKGVYQLIVTNTESKKDIYHGYLAENLAPRFKDYLEKEFNKASSNIYSDNYSDLKFHLLVFEPKSKGKLAHAECLNLESLFTRTAEPHKRFLV